MAPCTLTGLSLGPVVSLGRRVVFITVTEALVIIVIVTSATGPMALASLGDCFYALTGHLVLILDKKTTESSLIMEPPFTAQYFNNRGLVMNMGTVLRLEGVCLLIRS